MTKSKIIAPFFLVLFLTASLTIQAEVTSPAPETQETAKLLFSMINLSMPEMKDVKISLGKGDFTGALKIYRDLFINNLAKKNFGELGYWNQGYSDANAILGNVVMIGRHIGGVSTNNIGEPGHINWFLESPDGNLDWATHLSSMQFTPKLADAFDKTKDPKYVRKFIDIWEDFYLNHRRQLNELGAAGKKDRHTSADACYCGLYSTWRMDALMTSLNHMARTDAKVTRENISPEKLATILALFARDNVDYLVEKAFPGAPNQYMYAATEIIKASMALTTFNRAEEWNTFGIAKAKAYVENAANMKDGTDLEQSPGYNVGMIKECQTLMTIYGAETVPEWLAGAMEKVKDRFRFLTGIIRPGGNYPAMDQTDARFVLGSIRTMQTKLNDSVAAKVISGLGDNGKDGIPAFTSILFPYGGYTVMRSDWTTNAHYLFFKTSRMGSGHHQLDGNSIAIDGFGRQLLIDSGPCCYTGDDGRERFNQYQVSTFAHNTVIVDGCPQIDTKPSPAKAYETPIEARWLTSDNFDFSEGLYDGAYKAHGELGETKAKDTPVIKDVRHLRQVIFLRKQGCWIVTDRLISGAKHTYSQIWKFPAVPLVPSKDYPTTGFSADEVIVNDKDRCIKTSDSKGANVAVYNFSGTRLRYNKYYGQESPLRGWVQAKHFTDPLVKAVDVHVDWASETNSILVTLIYPMKNTKGEIKNIRSISNDRICGFELTLNDGTKVCYQTGADESEINSSGILAKAETSLVVCEKGDSKISGIVLGGREMSVNKLKQTIPEKDFEFRVTNGSLSATNPIKIPSTFAWKNANGKIQPEYE